MSRAILITGCSSGIGHDAALTLRGRGWRVFAGVRRAEDAARLASEGLETVMIEMAEESSIAAGLAEVLENTGGRLDALYNNAAYAMPGAVEDIPTQALREIFEANLFGLHELTRRVIPVMRAQGHGRIINCSSVLGLVPMPWRGPYVATKYALEGLTDTLRIEMRDTPIHVCLIAPGPITTKIRANSIPHFEKWVDWKASPRRAQYEDSLLDRLYAPKTGKDVFELPPAAVTKRLVHALEAKRPRPRYHVTGATHIMAALRRVLPTRALDWIIAKG